MHEAGKERTSARAAGAEFGLIHGTRSQTWVTSSTERLSLRRSRRLGFTPPPKQRHPMTRLHTVTIRRFKGLKEVSLPVSDVTLLIGANNAGKSSVLQAIHFAVSLAQSARLIGEGVTWQRDKFELSFNPAQLIYTPVADVMSLATGGVLQESRENRIEIQIATEDGSQCTVGLRRGRNRNIAVQIEGRTLGEQLMDLTLPFSVYAPGLAGVPKSEGYVSPGVVRRIVARGDANLVLRNVLRMLCSDNAKWDTFLKDMQAIFPGIKVLVGFNENTDEHIEAQFELPGGPKLPVDAAGTSILQASQILAYVGLFSPKVLILDEPDSHLHPNNQRALCKLIERLARERGFKAMISTHSRHVLDSMRDTASVIWMSKSQIVPATDTDTTQVLLDLGALDSADYFANGSIKCVVATEDTDTAPLAALLWSNGFHKDDTHIASYAGCGNADAAIVLGSFLKSKAKNVSLVVHVDRDYRSEASINSFKSRLEKIPVHAFVTEFSDIEGSFLNPLHLSYANPSLSSERAAELIEQATNDVTEASVKAIVDQRTREAHVARREMGSNVDHGQIAVDSHRDYLANPKSMRRGKLVLKKLWAAIQKEIGTNPRVYVESNHLQVASLKEIAESIWPKG